MEEDEYFTKIIEDLKGEEWNRSHSGVKRFRLLNISFSLYFHNGSKLDVACVCSRPVQPLWCD